MPARSEEHTDDLPSRRWLVSDLAPGDTKSAALDISTFTVHAIDSDADPAFGEVYQTLWQEFGASGELEQKEVLARRLRWPRGQHVDEWVLRYAMLAVSDGSGVDASVRDHSVIIPPPRMNGGDPPLVVVHLSHLFVAPPWRRTGLAGWMRAMPLRCARDCLGMMLGAVGAAKIILVAEMDPPDPGIPERLGRLLAYERAGFQAIDPSAVKYFQPDFGTPETLRARGKANPLPMNLIVRRVGRELESTLDGDEVREVVRALYRMYADGCRQEDIFDLEAQLEKTYPRPGEMVRLLPPTLAAD